MKSRGHPVRFLSIETSTKYSVVAISDEAGLIYGEERLFEKRSSEGLGTLVRHCLKKTRLGLEDIGCFAVGCGPGSFTGLRIGVSFVKGLSFGLEKPCVAFSSLDAIAFGKSPLREGRLCVIVDAKRSNVYSSFYSLSPLAKTSGDLLLPFARLKQKIASGTAFTGDAVHIYADALQGCGASALLPQRYWYPTAQGISRSTLEAFKKGEVLDCFRLRPRYLYRQDCQVKKTC